MNTFLAAFLIAALAGLGGYYLHEVIEPRFEVAAVGNGGAIRVESRSGNTWRLIVHDEMASVLNHFGIQSKIPNSRVPHWPFPSRRIIPPAF